MDNTLEQSIIHLVRHKRFYAHMLFRMKKILTNKDVPTAGVRITPEGIVLYVNAHFWSQFTKEEQAGILEHECGHLISKHFEREKELDPKRFEKSKDKSIIDQIKDMIEASDFNKAEDIAINQRLPNLPKEFFLYDENGKPVPDENGKVTKFPACTVETLEAQLKPMGIKVERDRTTEYYYKLLKQAQQKSGKKVQVGITIDSHGMLKSDEIDPEFKKEMVKALVNKAARDCGAGNIPGNIQHLIEELNKRSKDWRKDIRKFTANCTETRLEVNSKKRNRRYPMLYPGFLRYPELVLGVAVDSSASVNEDQLEQFFAEMKGLHNLKVKIIVLECDTQVNNVYLYDPSKPIKVRGRGGTYFYPVFDEIEKPEFKKKFGEVDGLIYLTDGGDYGDKAKKPKYPVMWALLPNCDVRYSWGMKTKVEVKPKL